MGLLVYSLFRVMQDLCHQQYYFGFPERLSRHQHLIFLGMQSEGAMPESGLCHSQHGEDALVCNSCTLLTGWS